MLSQSPAACSAHPTTRALPPLSNPPHTALSLFCKSHKAPLARMLAVPRPWQPTAAYIRTHAAL
eukprot:6232649-Prymnesium_polylepis.1